MLYPVCRIDVEISSGHVGYRDDQRFARGHLIKRSEGEQITSIVSVGQVAALGAGVQPSLVSVLLRPGAGEDLVVIELVVGHHEVFGTISAGSPHDVVREIVLARLITVLLGPPVLIASLPGAPVPGISGLVGDPPVERVVKCLG